ncbi:MAG: hypothetical protein AAB774_02795 [Patescibacteria group bacterium]
METPKYFTPENWWRICEGLGVTIIRPTFAYLDLLSRYKEPNRDFHNAAYIDHCFQLWEEHRSAFNFDNDWYNAGFALAYHRAVCLPSQEDNELENVQSAERMWQMLGLDEVMFGIPRLMIEELSQSTASWPGSRLVSDIVLAVTYGGDWEACRKNSRRIRQEAKNVPD